MSKLILLDRSITGKMFLARGAGKASLALSQYSSRIQDISSSFDVIYYEVSGTSAMDRKDLDVDFDSKLTEIPISIFSQCQQIISERNLINSVVADPFVQNSIKQYASTSGIGYRETEEVADYALKLVLSAHLLRISSICRSEAFASNAIH